MCKRKTKNPMTVWGPGPLLQRVLVGIEKKGYELTIRGTEELRRGGVPHSDSIGISHTYGWSETETESNRTTGGESNAQ